MKCNYVCEKRVDDLLACITKALDVLSFKLESNNNSILRDLAITDFLMVLLEETNKLTPFKYSLQMENDDN